MQIKNSPVRRLLEIASYVPIWPGRFHNLTLAEAAVSSTGPMQRLRRLRQIGLAYHELPLSEHTRFSHSLGTSYWAMRMLEGVSLHNRETVGRLETHLGPDISLKLLIRLFALVHDIALLPLGHTMRFQLNLFEGPSLFDNSMRDCLSRVLDQCADHLFAAASDATEARSLVTALESHFELVSAVTRLPKLLAGATPLPLKLENASTNIVASIPVLAFIYDVVHGVYSADLIDICMRDMFATGRAWEVPMRLLMAGRVISCEASEPSWPSKARSNGHGFRQIFRYGVDATEGGVTDTAVLTDLLNVHQTRFEIAEKAFYSRKKCIADAMFDKCIRLLRESDAHGLELLLDPPTLLQMGDDALIDGLIALEKASKSGCRSLATDIRDGVLFEEVLVLDASRHPTFDKVFGHLQSEAERTELETRISGFAGVDQSDVIVGILPERMQSKHPDTLVQWHNDRVLPFEELASRIGFPAAATSLAEQYRQLRRVSVCAPANYAKSQGVIEASRKAFFS